MAGGRPSKLTDELCEAICQNIIEGNTIIYSCQKEGIDKSQFYRWMKKGERSKSGKFRNFYNSIKKAKEESKSRLVKGIEEHGKKNWQALAWLLERQYPKEFGRRENVKMEHTGKLKQEVNVNVHNRIKEYNDYFDQLPESSDNGNDTG